MEQLRLACLHPQMTQYWRGLANELQLAQVVRLASIKSITPTPMRARAGSLGASAHGAGCPLQWSCEQFWGAWESTAGRRQAALWRECR